MRHLLIFLMLSAACASQVVEDDIETSEQEYNSNPPPQIICETPRIACGSICVDISRDMKNCGGCGLKCNIADGEFCLGHYCRNVREFGFTLEPNGPRKYDVRLDLPRPVPVSGEDLK